VTFGIAIAIFSADIIFHPRSRTPVTAPDDIFFQQSGLDRGRVQELVDESLHGSDDGELYLEYKQSETFAFDDGRLKAATFDTTQGFGLRAVAGVGRR